MAIFESIRSNSSSGGLPGAIARLVLRLLQFVVAVTVAGLYGIDLQHGNQNGIHPDSKWWYAEAVAGLSALTCILYGLPFFKSWWGFGWDFILFVLWTALFGLFGSIYLPAFSKSTQDVVPRMMDAAWFDLAGMSLWFITATYSTIIWYRGRNKRSLHTGRAKV